MNKKNKINISKSISKKDIRFIDSKDNENFYCLIDIDWSAIKNLKYQVAIFYKNHRRELINKKNLEKFFKDPKIKQKVKSRYIPNYLSLLLLLKKLHVLRYVESVSAYDACSLFFIVSDFCDFRDKCMLQDKVTNVVEQHFKRYPCGRPVLKRHLLEVQIDDVGSGLSSVKDKGINSGPADEPFIVKQMREWLAKGKKPEFYK